MADMHRDEYFRRVGYDEGYRRGARFGFLVCLASTTAGIALWVFIMIHKWGLPWTGQ